MTTLERTPSFVVDKIYVTRTRYRISPLSNKPSKVAGLVVDGQIYWLKSAFTEIALLTRTLSQLNIGLTESNTWGMLNHYGQHASGILDKKITKINKETDLVFDINSSYMRRTARTSEGSIFWDVKTLRDQFPQTKWAVREF
jgi:hypothetical protein